MKKILINRWVGIFVLLFFVIPLAAQEPPEKSQKEEQPTENKAEHPAKDQAEHPTEKGAEHPAEHQGEHSDEHPAEHPAEASSTPITQDNLAKAVVHYVKSKSDENKKFIVKDPETGKDLQLTLLKVHKERLSGVGDGVYFACADFKDKDGKVYDLDVFMEGKTADKLSFRKFLVHKEEGVERYGWQEEKGVWKRVKLEKKK